MIKQITKTGERILPEKLESAEEYLIFLRHLFAYEFAKHRITKTNFVLEVGCGEGYGSSLISRYASKIIGLDVDDSVITYASKKYGSENCFFEVYDGLKIPYEKDTFDVIVSFQVIEHIKDDINYLSEIYRVLKKNGIFILSTPNKTHRLKPNQKPWNRFHIREYNPQEIENLLKNKFFDVKVWGICGNEEIQRIELDRLKLKLKIVSFDPFNLRNLIPKQISPIIIRTIEKISRMFSKKQNIKANEDFFKKYQLNNYYIEKINVNDSLDLLGICKK